MMATNQCGFRLVVWYHMPTEPVSPKISKSLAKVSPSLMHDDEGDIPSGEPTSTCAPRGTDDLLRVFGYPRNGSGSPEFFSEDTLEFS